jgi:CheY-like chemotaxis protein
MKKKVLVIEDQKEIRRVIRRVLTAEDFEVLEAADGQEGLDLARENPPDLIVTDIFMPEMDGLEFIRTARKLNAQVRILAISGGGAMGNMQMLAIARSLGAGGVLAKPFGRDELIEAVRQALAAPIAARPK